MIFLFLTSLFASLSQEALQYPVAFAQVREDPFEEREVIQNYFPNGKLEVLMVGSGGDTAAYLAGSDLSISKLVIVDPNPSQIYLTKLKLHLLQAPKEKRLQILGHAYLPPAIRTQELATLMQELEIPKDAFGTAEEVSAWGLDYAGRYEVVFKALRDHLAPFSQEIEALFSCRSIEEQKERIAPHTSLGRALDAAFDTVMSQENLVQIFGEKATANRVQEFSRHFAERTRTYLSTHLAAESPFLAQVLLGHFYRDVHYPWLDFPAQAPRAAIEFHPLMMHQYLQQVPKESFDLIHLSNITDWLSPEEARSTLSLAYQALKPGGVVTLRQLNSHLDLYSLGEEFLWDRQMAATLHYNDRSFFYKQLLIGVKKKEARRMADAALEQVPILQGKFFRALHSQEMRLEQFQKTQQQFFFAVDYFSRPMAALIARLPEHAQRLPILENIVEEHGNMDPTHFHSNTFKQFLTSIGSSPSNSASPSVLAFNLDLMGVSLSEDPYTALGVFGIIEYAFADISASIGKAVVKKGWVPESDLIHYSLHAQLDKEHAEDFFALAEPHLHDPAIKASFQKGLELGAYIFNRLYDDLYDETR